MRLHRQFAQRALFFVVSNRFFHALFAEKVQAMLDDGWIIDWLHADRAVEILDHCLHVWDLHRGHVEAEGLNKARFFADLRLDVVVQLIVAIVDTLTVSPHLCLHMGDRGSRAELLELAKEVLLALFEKMVHSVCCFQA